MAVLICVCQVISTKKFSIWFDVIVSALYVQENAIPKG
jgi:hypothetical protein